jgi:hypothetical protein
VGEEAVGGGFMCWWIGVFIYRLPGVFTGRAGVFTDG